MALKTLACLLCLSCLCLPSNGSAPDAPTWRYFGINSDSPTDGNRSGLIFNFENAAATANVDLCLDVDGQHLDLKTEVRTDRVHDKDAGYVHFPIKNLRTLHVVKVAIVAGEYSGVYDALTPGQAYQLVRQKS